jgi:hypothetical protein
MKSCILCKKESFFGDEHEYHCTLTPKCKYCLIRLDKINMDDKLEHHYACKLVPKCKYCFVRLDEEGVIHNEYCKTVPKCDQCMVRVDTPLPNHANYCLCITRCASCHIIVPNYKEDCKKNTHLDTCITKQECSKCKSSFICWQTINGQPQCRLCRKFYIN